MSERQHACIVRVQERVDMLVTTYSAGHNSVASACVGYNLLALTFAYFTSKQVASLSWLASNGL